MKFAQKKISKYALLIAACGLLVSGCTATPTHKKTEVEPPIKNARVNIDWPGTYQGILPCPAACDGIATMLVLYPDNRFSLRTRKIGLDIKDKITDGRIQWQENGNNLALIGDEPLPTVINHIRINRESISIYPQPATPGLEATAIELDKTGAVPTPPPTI